MTARSGVAGNSPPPATRLLLALVAALLLAGCSVRKLAVHKLADTLAEGGSAFSSDEDPELVRDAVPFALKTMEMLLVEDPDHLELRLAAGRGFTQYAFAFVQLDSEEIQDEDFFRSEELRQRALALYLRARGHLLYALESSHPGIGQRLRLDPAAAADEIGLDEAELAYWTALSWGAAVGIGKDRPELLGDIDTIGALLQRVEVLDESFADGGVHEALLTYEAARGLSGGSYERAEEHFHRAEELSGGHQASLYVSYAESIAKPRQERETYIAMLGRALEVDPDAVLELRLENRVYQRRARWLLDRVDDVFLPTLEELPEEGGEE